jgi:hypothetical protein
MKLYIKGSMHGFIGLKSMEELMGDWNKMIEILTRRLI